MATSSFAGFWTGWWWGHCMLMQNRTLASARPAMTAQGGLPTFLLEALNGRIAPHVGRSGEADHFSEADVNICAPSGGHGSIAGSWTVRCGFVHAGASRVPWREHHSVSTERQMAISQARLNTSRGPRQSNYRLSHRRMNPSSPCGRKITIAMKMRPTGIR